MQIHLDLVSTSKTKFYQRVELLKALNLVQQRSIQRLSKHFLVLYLSVLSFAYFMFFPPIPFCTP